MKFKNLALFVISSSLLTSCASPIKILNFSLFDLSSEIISFHSEKQEAYLNEEDYSKIYDYAIGSLDLDKPNAIKLSWDFKEKNNKEPLFFDVQVSETSDFSDSNWSFYCKENSCDLYNVKLDTTYYWSVFAVYDGESYQSETSSFKINDKMFRNINIDGVMNFRDLGSYGHIKQGLIYRSARFNESSVDEVKLTITNDGLDKIKNQLHIKSEIDLRRTSDNEVGGLTDKSPLGDDINYYQCPMIYGGDNILKVNPEEIKHFFEICSDISNYPLVFHCSIGKDRTGCMAYLLEGLLGVEEEYLYKDYLFSNFAKINASCSTNDIDSRYGKTLKLVEGNSLSEKIYKYLNETTGVSKDILDKVISNLSI